MYNMLEKIRTTPYYIVRLSDKISPVICKPVVYMAFTTVFMMLCILSIQLVFKQ